VNLHGKSHSPVTLREDDDNNNMEQYLEQKFFAELVDISRSIVEFEAIEEWKNQQPVVKELTKELIKLVCSSEGATDCTWRPIPTVCCSMYVHAYTR
jgi:hypothetical protein